MVLEYDIRIAIARVRSEFWICTSCDPWSNVCCTFCTRTRTIAVNCTRCPREPADCRVHFDIGNAMGPLCATDLPQGVCANAKFIERLSIFDRDTLLATGQPILPGLSRKFVQMHRIPSHFDCHSASRSHVHSHGKRLYQLWLSRARCWTLFEYDSTANHWLLQFWSSNAGHAHQSLAELLNTKCGLVQRSQFIVHRRRHFAHRISIWRCLDHGEKFLQILLQGMVASSFFDWFGFDWFFSYHFIMLKVHNEPKSSVSSTFIPFLGGSQPTGFFSVHSATTPWLALLALEIEHDMFELETKLWPEIIRQLHATSSKFSMDNIVKVRNWFIAVPIACRISCLFMCFSEFS